MLQNQLDVIRKRCEDASPAPWEMRESVWNDEGHYASWVALAEWAGGDCICDDCSRTNAIFIAHARQDIPALLAEVERLKDLLCRADALIEDLEQDEKYPFGWNSYETEIRP